MALVETSSRPIVSYAASASKRKPPASPARTRIDYLDGIRGLAALAITLMHMLEIFGMGGEPVGVYSDALLNSRPFDRLLEFSYSHFFQRANYAVEIFIVLSGYSLMLGVARSRDGQLKGGMRGYFTRRIRRIWPPYFAALLLSLLIIFVVPGMNEKNNVWWDIALPVTPEALFTHATFTHTLHPPSFFKINPPMWTVAVEEQIYIVFPLLLLPVWRRCGSRAMVAVAIVVGVSSWFVFRPYLANPWYLGLFALGALGATVNFSQRAREQGWHKRIAWGRVGLVTFMVFYILSEATARFDFGVGDPSWFVDLTLGLAVTCLLIKLSEQWKTDAPQGRFSALRLLQLPRVSQLGRFSYSLYLMHAPILACIALVVLKSGIRSLPAYAIMLFVGMPIALASCYLFHLAFERPFMPESARKAATPATESVAALPASGFASDAVTTE